MADDDIDPELEAALEAQQWLAESSLGAVFEAYDEAVEQGLEAPVVVLVDCEDELGSEIARGWLGDEAVDDAILWRESDDQLAAEAEESAEDELDEDEERTTVFARAVGWTDCRDEIAEAFPYLSDAFDEGPPDDGVLVISITAGGASALTAPFDLREEDEE
ncbi:MAG: hypothetical protein ACRCT8_14770 [Lacipirellulaceae bacterium]